ncbi:probable serine/threonine-protein kinase [Tanacetum coccineum]
MEVGRVISWPICEVQPEVVNLVFGGHWYTLRELDIATNGFSSENVIGEGGYGIVYSGVLADNTMVAVKNLLNNSRTSVKSVSGAQRILVYEYVNNGNLEQWLHGDVGPVSPLTWELVMNICYNGMAKGLTYLHEGLEPKVVHRDIKSSNILLDRQWKPKVFRFWVMLSFWAQRRAIYVAPEYASTGMLNERSDVYSFGILIMEIISGRNPVDYGRPADEVNLVDWLKTMVTNRNAEGVLDPKLPEKPSSRALKRALLVALRCVDPSAQKRPKMGHVIHMLEADDFPFREEHRANRVLEKRCIESGDSSGYESSKAPGSSN